MAAVLVAVAIAGVVALSLILYLIWRAWFLYGDGKGMVALNFYRPFELLSKTTLVEGDGHSLPVVRFTFALPQHSSLQSLGFDLGRGSFVKVKAPRGARPYSPTSEVTRKGSFDLTVKIYPNGRVSEHLNGLSVGDVAMCSGPGPVPWIHIRRREGRGFGLIAFGVGITEIIEVAKCELARESCAKLVLLWVNRTWSDVFDLQSLSELVDKSGGRLGVTHVLSREKRDGCFSGRISAALLNEAFAPLLDLEHSRLRFLAVGTRSMKQHAARCLQELGFGPSAQLLYKRPGWPCPKRKRTPDEAETAAE
ncbi:unnamed protein product [Effrenium voratum]|nr:unnamed protein product [Effrenium voratum]